MKQIVDDRCGKRKEANPLALVNNRRKKASKIQVDFSNNKTVDSSNNTANPNSAQFGGINAGVMPSCVPSSSSSSLPITGIRPCPHSDNTVATSHLSNPNKLTRKQRSVNLMSVINEIQLLLKERGSISTEKVIESIKSKYSSINFRTEEIEQIGALVKSAIAQTNLSLSYDRCSPPQISGFGRSVVLVLDICQWRVFAPILLTEKDGTPILDEFGKPSEIDRELQYATSVVGVVLPYRFPWRRTFRVESNQMKSTHIKETVRALQLEGVLQKLVLVDRQSCFHSEDSQNEFSNRGSVLTYVATSGWRHSGSVEILIKFLRKTVEKRDIQTLDDLENHIAESVVVLSQSPTLMSAAAKDVHVSPLSLFRQHIPPSQTHPGYSNFSATIKRERFLQLELEFISFLSDRDFESHIMGFVQYTPQNRLRDIDIRAGSIIRVVGKDLKERLAIIIAPVLLHYRPQFIVQILGTHSISLVERHDIRVCWRSEFDLPEHIETSNGTILHANGIYGPSVIRDITPLQQKILIDADLANSKYYPCVSCGKTFEFMSEKCLREAQKLVKSASSILCCQSIYGLPCNYDLRITGLKCAPSSLKKVQGVRELMIQTTDSGHEMPSSINQDPTNRVPNTDTGPSKRQKLGSARTHSLSNTDSTKNTISNYASDSNNSDSNLSISSQTFARVDITRGTNNRRQQTDPLGNPLTVKRYGRSEALKLYEEWITGKSKHVFAGNAVLAESIEMKLDELKQAQQGALPLSHFKCSSSCERNKCHGRILHKILSKDSRAIDKLRKIFRNSFLSESQPAHGPNIDSRTPQVGKSTYSTNNGTNRPKLCSMSCDQGNKATIKEKSVVPPYPLENPINLTAISKDPESQKLEEHVDESAETLLRKVEVYKHRAKPALITLPSRERGQRHIPILRSKKSNSRVSYIDESKVFLQYGDEVILCEFDEPAVPDILKQKELKPNQVFVGDIQHMLPYHVTRIPKVVDAEDYGWTRAKIVDLKFKMGAILELKRNLETVARIVPNDQITTKMRCSSRYILDKKTKEEGWIIEFGPRLVPRPFGKHYE